MGNCLKCRNNDSTVDVQESEGQRRVEGDVRRARLPAYFDNDPILHPAPGVSRPMSQLTEEEQVKIATRMGLISTLPFFIFDESKREKLSECIICMCEYEEGEELRSLPCLHTYHRICIDDWLMRSLTCPSCLEEIRPNSPVKTYSSPIIPHNSPVQSQLLEPLTTPFSPTAILSTNSSTMPRTDNSDISLQSQQHGDTSLLSSIEVNLIELRFHTQNANESDLAQSINSSLDKSKTNTSINNNNNTISISVDNRNYNTNSNHPIERVLHINTQSNGNQYQSDNFLIADKLLTNNEQQMSQQQIQDELDNKDDTDQSALIDSTNSDEQTYILDQSNDFVDDINTNTNDNNND